jgi:glutathione S-transferase
MFFEQYSHEPNIATVRFWVSHDQLTPERSALLESKRALGYAALDVMERHLSTRSYFVGDHYTVADIALYAYTHVAEEGASISPVSRRSTRGCGGARAAGLRGDPR